MKIRFTGNIIINPEEELTLDDVKECIEVLIVSSNIPYENYTLECKEIKPQGRPRLVRASEVKLDD